ncbi:phosphatidylinositol 4-phosphate 5-kinase-like protein 1 [Engraulis encrasicolus]|uniref:phosphatidylinositol 4-phosphate 5-kinase-like protein 1 n=1 Tax=Engraulis encrasicolus TaxID=184585 RepID=UPI002FD09182
MEKPKKPRQRRSATVGRRLWARLTRRWRLLGLFEIDEDHEFYNLTVMMKEGLAAALQSTDQPAQDELTADDYTKEESQVHEGFEMQTFAGPVFASLRRSLDVSEQDYQSSLSSAGPFLQFISNSKSKADFFLTNDKCYFLKTQSKREINFLLSNLRKYTEHLEKYPHSLMVRFLGVHRIIIHGDIKKYFIVMHSVFYPDERIQTRYDVKGCEVGRWTDPTPREQQPIVVLKDMNFEGQHINLGEQKSWLVRQVEIDTGFLRGLGVLDYSVLLAHQPLHLDEMDQNQDLATLVLRTTISVDIENGPTEPKEPPKIPGTLAEEDTALLQSEPQTGDPAAAAAEPADDQPRTTLAEDPVSGIPLQELPSHRHSEELKEFQAQNRRLLPEFKNPVHVIDGPELRYFVGVVDFFTEYGLKKRLENLWKRIRFPGRAFSTVSPPDYAQRFCQWVQSHTK